MGTDYYYYGLSKYGAMKRSGFAQTLKSIIKNHPLGSAGIAIGLSSGAYLGNSAWNNTIPPVRQLPDFTPQPYVDANQPGYLKDQQTGQTWQSPLS